MRRSLAVVLFALAMLILFAAPQVGAQSGVELVVFHSKLCASCQVFDAEILPPLQQAYGASLRVRTVDITTAEGMRELEQAEARADSYQNPLPVLLLDGELLANQDVFALGETLEARLVALLGTANDHGTATASTPTPVRPATPAPGAEVSPSDAPPIHVAYIVRPYCAVCDRAAIMLQVIALEFPQMVVHEFDQVEEADLVEAMGQYLGLPEVRRLVAPSLYIGQDALVYTEVTSDALREILTRYADTGAPQFWQGLDADTGALSILGRFRAMGLITVIAAGLIDGINPCAFATILFFVSYLAISHRRRSEMILVGLAFTLGIFVVHFAAGLGAMQILEYLKAIRQVGLVIYTLLAVSCLVFAVLSFRDYVLVRQGRLSDMRLKLPESVRRYIHTRIRTSRNSFWGVAFVTGLIISVLELACTGQVYLPTISFVLSVPEMRASAVMYLLLYNILFVTPLLIVLFAVTFGANTQSFQRLFVRHAGTAKIGMAVLFLVLGALLMWQVLIL